jgi:PAS domain S-box-containing protein
VREHLVELTEKAITFLLTEPFDHGQAQAIGASLVGLHYVEPEALGRTQEVLVQQLVGGLSADQVAALQLGLVALLGGVATGFFEQAREAILSEQERVRGALIRELRQAEEETLRLSSAVRTSVDGIVIMDVEGKITYVNEAALKLYGTDEKEDMIGRYGLDLIASEQRERGLAGIGFVLEKGYDKSRGYEVMTKDGSRIPVELNAAVMKDADGKPIGIVSIIRDITERTRVEEALWERERHLRTVVTGAPIVLFAVDREGVITLEEGRGLDAVGRKPGECVGRLVSDAFWDVPLVGENVRRALAGEEFASIVEIAGVTFETRYSPLRGENGEIVGVIGVGTDITERRRV